MVPKIQAFPKEEDSNSLGVIPWFSYRVNFPERPLPPASERPHIRTPRLMIRPIQPEDLEQFHALRSIPELQGRSPTRGRVDRDLEETRRNIERLQPPNDTMHWYFGAFLESTGEMIGEAGMPDCLYMPRSGWPEGEILIKPQYWRQGYGTEFLQAILDAWWALPRGLTRHQLLTLMAGDKEPGDRVIEKVGFIWEESNTPARDFFAKVLGPSPAYPEGAFLERDVQWTGILAANPQDTGQTNSGGLKAGDGKPKFIS